MMTLHPQIIEKDGKKEFVVLPYEEFILIKEELENYEDLKDLREAKENSKHEESLP
ncbi:MAG: type II toxin-antitoxin system Phd/YefM family antitoxin [Candidatus Scalindua sp. AMX11]|nr:MAG: type II toxin-antitoxin system Phd/YefM family antitoxin [Candidatus Scalindua sp.]NOG85587.1 type II toxin-antitoxin system Phd/YefM family antitoxin [Planctomycetota bacterium]RZV90297.1 MAG: type II toxin-antitoxin system Phd/YefM family antitoxin [Candidatus Scalindua sp. SCAELEC01]TDE65016.1 MAG: type II toxin-antitoxin system Phd/YefM family antitoxin [Candidatus Scalindua sp. AMX11]